MAPSLKPRVTRQLREFEADRPLSSLEIPNPPSDTRCYFLELPTEIRMMIYRYYYEYEITYGYVHGCVGFSGLDHFCPWPSNFNSTGGRWTFARSDLHVGEILYTVTGFGPRSVELGILKIAFGFVSTRNTDADLEFSIQAGGPHDSFHRYLCPALTDRIFTYPHSPFHGKPKADAPSNLSSKTDTLLLFVCRKITEEYSALLYSRIVFGLASSRTIQKFMMQPKWLVRQTARMLRKTVPASPIGLPFIRALCLQCSRPSQPKGTLARTVQALQCKYYDNWKSSCLSMIEKLVSLNNLALSIEVPEGDDAILALDTYWVAPFVQFSQCKRLQFVSVSLRSSGRFMTVYPLKALAEAMRRKILGWDDLQALAAITDASKEFRVDYRGQSLDDEWKQLGEWNKINVWPNV